MTSIREAERKRLEQELMAIAERNEARACRLTDDIPDFQVDRDVGRRQAVMAKLLTCAAAVLVVVAVVVASAKESRSYYSTSYTGEITQLFPRK